MRYILQQSRDEHDLIQKIASGNTGVIIQYYKSLFSEQRNEDSQEVIDEITDIMDELINISYSAGLEHFIIQNIVILILY